MAKETTVDVEAVVADNQKLAAEGKKAVNSLTDLEKAQQRLLKSSRQGNRELTRALETSMRVGNKALTSQLMTLQRFAKQAEQATAETQKLALRMNENIDSYKRAKDKIQELTQQIVKLQEKQKQNKTLTEEETKELQKLTEQRQEHENQVKEDTKALYLNQKAQEKFKQKIIDTRKAALSELEALKQRNNELHIMDGGVKAVGASISKAGTSKFFKLANDLATGAAATAMLLIGLKKLDLALAETADHMKAVSSVSISLGQEGRTGWSGFGNSMLEASETTSALMKASGELGIKMEELTAVAAKVRLGIRIDREGRLSEEAIRKMSTEAAKFSRVTGVEMGTAVDMMDKRIKQFGMTAEEARGDLVNMRVTLGQMTAGSNKNTVSMGEMVEILEEASAASQSYIVDTRLMTQAIRGAVNQSILLGASQKQAKDVAKATAKVFGTAPDWVKIPAGHDLMKQLLGTDSDQFIARFNSATQRQLKEMRMQVKTGQLGQESGSRALFTLISGSEAGVQAQFQQMKNVLFTTNEYYDDVTGQIVKSTKRNTEAAMIVKSEFGLENDLVAANLTTMLQDAAELQDRLGKDAIPFSAAMAKHAVQFNNSIAEAEAAGENAIEKLQKQGLSEEDAKKYFDFYKTHAKDQLDYEKQMEELANDRLMDQASKERKIQQLQEAHFTNVTKEQLRMAEEGINPIKKIMNAVKVQDIGVAIKTEDFVKAGYDSAQKLAKALGVTNEKDLKDLEAMYAKNGKMTGAQLEEMRLKNAKEAEKQQAAITSTFMLFSDGFFSGLDKLFSQAFVKMFGPLGGPIAKIVTGIALLAGGILALVKGPKLVEQMIYRGVLAGVKDAGGINKEGDGSKGSPGDSPEKKESTREERKKERSQKRQEARDRLKGSFKKGGLKNVIKGNWKTLGGKVGGVGGALMGGLALANHALDMKNDLSAIDQDTTLSAEEKQKQKNDIKYKKTGGMFGGFAGGLAGAQAGALLGTAILPGFGTAIGGLAGGAIGSYLGNAGGELAGSGVESVFSGSSVTAPQTTSAAGAITGASSAMTMPASGGAAGDNFASLGGAAAAGAAAMGGGGVGGGMSGGGGGSTSLIGKPQIGGLSSDGSVILKIENFLGLLSDAKQASARSGYNIFS